MSSDDLPRVSCPKCLRATARPITVHAAQHLVYYRCIWCGCRWTASEDHDLQPREPCRRAKGSRIGALATGMRAGTPICSSASMTAPKAHELDASPRAHVRLLPGCGHAAQVAEECQCGGAGFHPSRDLDWADIREPRRRGCPNCATPTPRMGQVDDWAQVHYYRSPLCGHVWAVNKADPNDVHDVMPGKKHEQK